MKLSLKFQVAILFFGLSLTAAQAQRGGWDQTPEERANKQTEEMTEALSLSEKQAEKVGEINLKYATKMKEARAANTSDDWSAMREAMMGLRKEQNDELKTVLTTEQFAQWNKLQEERRSQRQGRRGGKKTPEKKTEDNQR